MQTAAKLRYARVSPQKCRLVADHVRGKTVEDALKVLKYSPKKAGAMLRKLLDSAIANAEHNYGADVDELKVRGIEVQQAPTFGRTRARAKGRGNRILKRNSHISIQVSDE